MRQTPSALWADWAEPVPDAPFPMTTDEVMRLPDDDWQYELFEGNLIRMPLSGGEAAGIAVNLIIALGAFVKGRGLGWVTDGSGAYILSRSGQPDTTLAPDVAFVRAANVPPRNSADFKRAWRVAPDIVAEVASPHQFKPAMAKKAQTYLEAGTALVWVIWPERQEVDVWTPASLPRQAPITVLRAADALDGLMVLPGFAYPLADLFA